MNRLLTDLITAQPDKMHPIGELVFSVTHIFFSRAIPDPAGTVACRDIDYFSNSAISNLLNRRDVVHLPPILCASDNRRFIFCGQGMCLLAQLVSNCIDTDWLFCKNMFACEYRFLQHSWAKAWRCCEKDNINIRVVQYLFVSIKT